MSINNDNYFESIAAFRAEYTRLILEALQEGVAAVKVAVSSNKFIGTYHDYPSLRYKDNGLPDFSSSSYGGPVEYRNCFGGPASLINEDKLNTFNRLVDFVRAHPELQDRFVHKNWAGSIKKLDIELDSVMIKSTIKDAIERYIHTNISFEFDEEKACEAVAPSISYIFDQTLSIDIVVPVLFVNFEFDNHEIANGVYIKRLSESYQLARHKLISYNISTHQPVLSSATHALVFTNWSVPNQKHIWDSNILWQPRAYPIDLIDKFFGALRIATCIDTGYAQLLSAAIGWSAHCKAGLPYLAGASVRTYPSFFEDYYWNQEIIPKISVSDIKSISSVYNQLIEAKENSIDLAVKRLNRCLIRDSEEDSVLDATIALEALLSDDGNQEMTHKLAMRVGAISKLSANFSKSTQEAFRDIKEIYSYRSAIVHGSKNVDKKKLITVNAEHKVEAHALAVEYLRMLLKVLLENPVYRDPKKIDSDILLG